MRCGSCRTHQMNPALPLSAAIPGSEAPSPRRPMRARLTWAWAWAWPAPAARSSCAGPWCGRAVPCRPMPPPRSPPAALPAGRPASVRRGGPIAPCSRRSSPASEALWFPQCRATASTAGTNQNAGHNSGRAGRGMTRGDPGNGLSLAARAVAATFKGRALAGDVTSVTPRRGGGGNP